MDALPYRGEQTGHKQIRKEPGHAFQSKSFLSVVGMDTQLLDYEKPFEARDGDPASISGSIGGVGLFQLSQDGDLSAVVDDSNSFLVGK